jgi:hypothetical protein
MTTLHIVKTGLLAAFLMASAAPALASSTKTTGTKATETKATGVVSPPAACHARFNQSRKNCTIVSSQCPAGHVPVARPPACRCACQGLPPSTSSSKSKAPPQR